MGVERRRDTCSGVRRDGGRWLRKEIRRHEDILIHPDFGSRPKGANRTGLGEPNMGNPSVRFDEGRSGSAGLTTAVSSKPPPSTSPTLPLPSFPDNAAFSLSPHPSGQRVGEMGLFIEPTRPSPPAFSSTSRSRGRLFHPNSAAGFPTPQLNGSPFCSTLSLF